MDTYGYGNYFGSYTGNTLADFGDYNIDLGRLKQLVMSGDSSQLSTISSLAERLAERTADSELKDDLNTIALEAHYFEDYSHSNPWKRWQGYMQNVETSAKTAGASTTGSGGERITDARPPLTPVPTDADEGGMMKWLIIIAIIITLAGVGYYLYSTGAIG